MILATLACPVFTSCYDDKGLIQRVEDIEGEITDIKEKLAALEAKLNTDLEALKTLLENRIGALEGKVDGLVTVKDLKTNSNGSVVVTLSNGQSFTVYPAQDNSGLVTTLEMDGKLYWAVFDETGQPKLVTDADGNPVPVVDVVPQVKVDPETALVQISFDGGSSWISVGYNEPCVFSGVEVVYDEMTGAPLYVTVTLPDGNVFTVTVDGAAYFMFGNMYLSGPVESQFVSKGATATVEVAGMGIENWIKEVPAGWKVEENTQYFAEYGQAEFYVTAPTAEAIASGAAVAEGDLKVVAVAQGGKSITATLKLTTVPFESMSAAKGNVTVKMNNGLGGYLLGVSEVDAYDPEAIVAELKSVVEAYEEYENWYGDLVKEYTWSPWYVADNATTLDDNYMDSSVEEFPLESLSLATPLESGKQYVVWAVGLNAWYDNVTYQSGYTVADIVSTQYLNAFINLDADATVISFNDIQIKAEFIGVTEFFGGFEEQYPSYPTTVEDVVMNINESFSYGYAPTSCYVNDESVKGWDNGVYTGDPNTLVNGWQSIEPASDYIFYLIPVVPGKTVYTVSDVYWFEFTTESLMAGGSVNVTAGEATLDFKKISVPLAAEGAVYMYYKYIDPAMVSTLEDRAAYLIEKGTMAKGGSATASQANLAPGATMTLLAMAVDQYGCYGDVFQQEYTTKPMEYASATVVAELQGTPSTTGYVKFSCDAEVDTYYYWYGTKDNYSWTNALYFGGSKESASAFIALTPNSYLLKKVIPANLPAEGVLLSGLTIGSPSLVCVSAKLTDGTFTAATLAEFTPALNLGNFVPATDDNGNENAAWVAAKPTITYKVDAIGDFTTVKWSVSLPEGFFAKTACFSEDYLMDYPSAKQKVQYILSSEYIDVYDVADGEEYVNYYASKGYNIYTVVWNAEGDYYETFVEKLDISGGFGV